MIRLLTAVLLFVSFHAVAEVTLTPLNNNTPADADDVMGNFNALKTEIESLPLPPSDCSTDQIIKWDSSENAWICSSRASGTITMVDMWKADYTVGDSENVGFVALHGGSTFSNFGGAESRMVFTAGASEPNGFSFPEPGFYEVTANFSTFAPAGTSVQTIKAEWRSSASFGYYAHFRVRPAGVTNGSSEELWGESSMNFYLNVTDVEAQYLRFVFSTQGSNMPSEAFLGRSGNPKSSTIVFKRIEP